MVNRYFLDGHRNMALESAALAESPLKKYPWGEDGLIIPTDSNSISIYRFCQNHNKAWENGRIDG